VKILLSILLASLCGPAFTQNQVLKSEALSDKEIKSTFTDAVKNDLELADPILNAYKYADKSGQFYTVLSQNSEAGSTHSIRAVTAKYENGKFINSWEVNDYIDKKKGEQSISFWTKYTEFKDYDNDSRIDPIIVYRTEGNNESIRFVIYYNKQKIKIKNGDEKQIEIDKAFYSLPDKLQTSVKDKMERMAKNDHAIFPDGWQKGMADKNTVIK
jgi:hypothetical protein